MRMTNEDNIFKTIFKILIYSSLFENDEIINIVFKIFFFENMFFCKY